jgi:hypothetical protein
MRPWEDVACRHPLAPWARRQRARQCSFYCLGRHHLRGEPGPRRVSFRAAERHDAKEASVKEKPPRGGVSYDHEPPPSAAYAQTCGRVSKSQRRERRQRSCAVLHGVNLPKGKLLKRQPAAAVGVERVHEVARCALNLRGRGARLAVGRKQRGRLFRVNFPRSICAGGAGGVGNVVTCVRFGESGEQRTRSRAAGSAAARLGREAPASARSNVSLSCTSTSGSNMCSSFVRHGDLPRGMFSHTLDHASRATNSRRQEYIYI